MLHRFGSHVARHALLYVLLLVVAGGSASALPARNTVFSDDIVNGQVKRKDIGGNAVTGAKVADGSLGGSDLASGSVGGNEIVNDSLSGDDIDEATLGQVPSALSADTLGGLSRSAFARSTVYKLESAFGPGTALGDGTHVISQACNAGDILLAGGPANIAATSTLLESFPSPGSTNSWTARINKNGQADNFSVVILCLDQA